MAPVAMVTGGSRGIGRGITERLLHDGYRVSILATRPAPHDILDELGQLGEVAYTAGSIADLDDQRRYLEATLAAFGRVDVLVNNAGVAPSVRNDLLVATTDEFDRVLLLELGADDYVATARATKRQPSSTCRWTPSTARCRSTCAAPTS